MNPHNLSPGTCCTSIIVNCNPCDRTFESVVILKNHNMCMDEDMVQRPSCSATAALPSMHWRTAFGGVLQQWCKIKYSIPQYCFARHWHCTESSSIECTGALTGGRRVTYAPRSVSISPTLLPYCSFSASYSTITQPKSSTINRELSEHLQKQLKTLKWFLTAYQRITIIEILVTTSITKNMSSS